MKHTKLWSLVVISGLADTLTTVYGLNAVFTEGNPLVAGALSLGNPWIVLVSIKVLAIGVAIIAYRIVPQKKWLIPLSMSTPWMLAAIYNATLIW